MIYLVISKIIVGLISFFGIGWSIIMLSFFDLSLESPAKKIYFPFLLVVVFSISVFNIINIFRLKRKNSKEIEKYFRYSALALLIVVLIGLFFSTFSKTFLGISVLYFLSSFLTGKIKSQESIEEKKEINRNYISILGMTVSSFFFVILLPFFFVICFEVIRRDLGLFYFLLPLAVFLMTSLSGLMLWDSYRTFLFESKKVIKSSKRLMIIGGLLSLFGFLNIFMLIPSLSFVIVGFVSYRKLNRVYSVRNKVDKVEKKSEH